MKVPGITIIFQVMMSVKPHDKQDVTSRVTLLLREEISLCVRHESSKLEYSLKENQILYRTSSHTIIYGDKSSKEFQDIVRTHQGGLCKSNPILTKIIMQEIKQERNPLIS